jgi:hypothetical protein
MAALLTFPRPTTEGAGASAPIPLTGLPCEHPWRARARVTGGAGCRQRAGVDPRILGQQPDKRLDFHPVARDARHNAFTKPENRRAPR